MEMLGESLLDLGLRQHALILAEEAHIDEKQVYKGVLVDGLVAW